MKKRRPLSYPETQSFYCFGCGAGGVITFIKKINNVDYRGRQIPLRDAPVWRFPEEDDQTGRLRSRIISINKDAARYYFSRLNSDAGRVGRRTGAGAAFPTRPSSARPGIRAGQLPRRGII